MNLSAENYVSPLKTKKLDWAAWSATAFFVALWVGLIVAAPIFKAGGYEIANYIYAPFSYLCHQIAERSMHLVGEPLAVCSRCFGVYAGLALGVLAYPFLRPIYDASAPPRIVLFLAPVPTAVDWLLGFFGIWENTHLSRFLTAAILGLVCAFFVVPGIVDINRFFRLRKKKNAIAAQISAQNNSAPTDYSRPDLRI